MTGQRRHITRRPDGQWQDRTEGADRANSLSPTQHEAQQKATDALNNRTGGGEVIIHRPDGEIRAGNTINRPDPFPPKG